MWRPLLYKHNNSQFAQTIAGIADNPPEEMNPLGGWAIYVLY